MIEKIMIAMAGPDESLKYYRQLAEAALKAVERAGMLPPCQGKFCTEIAVDGKTKLYHHDITDCTYEWGAEND